MTEKEEAEAKMEARMLSGEPFTFAQLAFVGKELRWADYMLQRWRKRGLIEYERKGRHTIWRLTEAGRALATPKVS